MHEQLDVSSTNFSPPPFTHDKHAKTSSSLRPIFPRRRGFLSAPSGAIYTKYQEILTANNALDFDDLLLRTAHAFRAHPDMTQGAPGAVSVHPD